MRQKRWEVGKPGVRILIVLVFYQDEVPRDPASVASRDGRDDWVHLSWSSSSSQMGAISKSIMMDSSAV